MALPRARVDGLGAGVVRRGRIVIASVRRIAGTLDDGVRDAAGLAFAAAGLAGPGIGPGRATTGCGRAVVLPLVIPTAGLSDSATAGSGARARSTPGRIADRPRDRAAHPTIAVCPGGDTGGLVPGGAASRIARDATAPIAHVHRAARVPRGTAGDAFPASADGSVRAADVALAARLPKGSAGSAIASAVATCGRVMADRISPGVGATSLAKLTAQPAHQIVVEVVVQALRPRFGAAGGLLATGPPRLPTNPALSNVTDERAGAGCVVGKGPSGAAVFSFVATAATPGGASSIGVSAVRQRAVRGLCDTFVIEAASARAFAPHATRLPGRSAGRAKSGTSPKA